MVGLVTNFPPLITNLTWFGPLNFQDVAVNVTIRLQKGRQLHFFVLTPPRHHLIMSHLVYGEDTLVLGINVMNAIFSNGP